MMACPLLALRSDWDRFIGEPDGSDIGGLLHAHASTRRPLGPDAFVEALEQRLQRALKRQQPRPKPRQRDGHTLELFEPPEQR
ncbi:hypothetical protein [Thiocapsa bogorovii]|uniref:hypothetical protein n=1 Tax=Thiocapsa bogorovii TaxID=521689 RepID=UPI001E5B56A8|nr:hypothetical protein [Thiocapsa bogorovii]UHD16427.1 hypothetical protein LT988_24855 [Thiocapsa bogorovii]